MRFRVVMASDISGETKPCKAAFKDGMLLGKQQWAVDIATLEDLMSLYEEVGCDLIVNDGQIWIYDSHIE